MTISALSYVLVTNRPYRTERYSNNCFDRALMDDIEYEGTVKWELQLVDLIYQKTTKLEIFAGGESILDWLR